MSKNRRNKKTTVRSRKFAWLPIMATVSVLTLVIAGVNLSRPPIRLPDLSAFEDGGIKSPRIDMAEVAKFAQRRQIPEVPDLNQLSWHAAQDIYQALRQIEKRDQSAQAWGKLGRVFHSHEYLNQAIACYSRAMELDNRNHAWPYYIARIHADRFELESAINLYRASAKLEPNYVPTYLALGNIQLQLGELEKAQAAFALVVQKEPASSHGHLGLGQVAFGQQSYEPAIQHLRKAISMDASDFRAHNLLGRAYQQIGQRENSEFHLGIVRSLENKQQRKKFVAFDDPLYHEMLSENSTDAALHDRYKAAMATEQTKIAIQLAEELARRDPNHAGRRVELAQAYKQAKLFDKSLVQAEQAIGIDSQQIDALILKSQLLLILRRNQEAIKTLDTVVNLEPDSFDGHYNRGAALVLSRQYVKAEQAFRNAVRLQKNSARAHVALAETLGQLGRDTEAKQHYQTALQIEPSNQRARQKLGK